MKFPISRKELFCFILGLTIWIPLAYMIFPTLPLYFELDADMYGWQLKREYISEIKAEEHIRVSTHMSTLGLFFPYLAYSLIMLSAYMWVLWIPKSKKNLNAEVEEK